MALRKSKSPERDLRDAIRRAQEGVKEGEKLKTDKSEYHTLEEFPEPLEDLSEIVRKRFGGKKQLSEKELARREQLRKKKADNWLPGNSGNPAGRPTGSRNKTDPLKQIGLQIAFTNASLTLTAKERQTAKRLGYAPSDIRLIEAVMIHLATSSNPNKIALFLERTFGRVPNINIHAEYNMSLVQRFKSKLTDSELEQIAEGADVLDILLAKLPDVDDVDSETINSDDIQEGTLITDGTHKEQS